MRMRAGEAEEWLREQDAKWRCPSCGKPTSWYEERCHRCGGKIKEEDVAPEGRPRAHVSGPLRHPCSSLLNVFENS